MWGYGNHYDSSWVLRAEMIIEEANFQAGQQEVTETYRSVS